MRFRAFPGWHFPEKNLNFDDYMVSALTISISIFL